MKRDDLNDLAAFAVVAEQGSFTRAAAQLGMSQSALSHAMKALEERLGVRLLSRTTRSVSTTEAGETLLRSLRPALEDIEAGLMAVGGMREHPSGTVRLTATRHAATSVVMPVLPSFLTTNADVRVEVVVDDALIDIVTNRFDAGIRFGELVEKDMVAVRVGPDLQMAVVGAPSYFADRPPPRTPRDLARHRCIGYRSIRSGGVLAWEFEEKGRPFELRVEGPLVFNDGEMILDAALAGHGIAYAYEDAVSAHVAAGRLTRVLERWCPPFPGYYLYHPSRRQTPPALSALIAALRYRAPAKHARPRATV
jgi:DNA-binding transcriptional LysR family regulator